MTIDRLYDYIHGCEFYNMVWGAAGAVALGQVIPANERRLRIAAKLARCNEIARGQREASQEPSERAVVQWSRDDVAILRHLGMRLGVLSGTPPYARYILNLNA